MPAEPLIVDLLDALVRNLRAMSKANGYHFDYEDVVLGFYEWEAEAVHETPKLLVWLEPQKPYEGIGGEMSKNRFRWEDRVHIFVHLKHESSADGPSDIVRPGQRVRADLMKAFNIDRNLGQATNLANTFFLGTQCIPYPSAGPDILGMTVKVILLIRWEHATGDMTAGPS